MNVPKGNKKQSRLLARLERGGAIVEPLNCGTAILLRFEGERRVKCDAAWIQQWLSAGTARMDGDRLSLTDAGKASVKRAIALGMDHPYRAGHGVTATQRHEDGDVVARLVNLDESPLSRLATLRSHDGGKWLEPHELAAGERLRVDFESAQLRQRVTMSYDPSHVASGSKASRNGREDLSTGALSARQRVSDALDAVGPELGSIAMDVCCFLKGLEAVESERRWPRRSAKLLLKTALAGLGRHYFPVARGKAQAKGVFQWGTEDYRPHL